MDLPAGRGEVRLELGLAIAEPLHFALGRNVLAEKLELVSLKTRYLLLIKKDQKKLSRIFFGKKLIHYLESVSAAVVSLHCDCRDRSGDHVLAFRVESDSTGGQRRRRCGRGQVGHRRPPLLLENPSAVVIAVVVVVIHLHRVQGGIVGLGHVLGLARLWHVRTGDGRVAAGTSGADAATAGVGLGLLEAGVETAVGLGRGRGRRSALEGVGLHHLAAVIKAGCLKFEKQPS